MTVNSCTITLQNISSIGSKDTIEDQMDAQADIKPDIKIPTL